MSTHPDVDDFDTWLGEIRADSDNERRIGVRLPVQRDTPPTLAMFAAFHEDRPRCGSIRRNQYGLVVAACSFPEGHVDDHRDRDANRTWKAYSLNNEGTARRLARGWAKAFGGGR